MINSITFSGRLTDQLELRTSSQGNNFVDFTLAQNNFKESDKTLFVKCVAFGKIAELICNYCNKGDKLVVNGAIDISIYTNKDGKNVKDFKILVSNIEIMQGNDKNKVESNTNPSRLSSVKKSVSIEVEDDEIPF